MMSVARRRLLANIKRNEKYRQRKMRTQRFIHITVCSLRLFFVSFEQHSARIQRSIQNTLPIFNAMIMMESLIVCICFTVAVHVAPKPKQMALQWSCYYFYCHRVFCFVRIQMQITHIICVCIKWKSTAYSTGTLCFHIETIGTHLPQST